MQGPKGTGGNPFYVKPRFTRDPFFVVKHFAGEVTYAIEGFIEKNRDALNAEVRDMLVHSSNDFMLCLFGSGTQKRPGMLGYIESLHGSSAAQEAVARVATWVVSKEATRVEAMVAVAKAAVANRLVNSIAVKVIFFIARFLLGLEMR